MPAAPPRILCVCSGNLHRSVMAAALIDAMLKQAGRPALVGSAGTLGLQSRPAPPQVVEVCAELGLDVSEHLSRPLTLSVIQPSDAIIVMEDQHGERVLKLDETAETRLFYLGDYADEPGDIFDPIGSPTATFRQSRDHILSCLQRLLPDLLRLLDLGRARV